ncbi:hypothetical protein C479_09213 [Halovivax asiaticus JCM 14624]|uniref:Halobacterial output domain-containing protein n=1 Tax=Halovivax asiaticus JCM 14624 TaxID=1227490 RepID=M0BKZ6_9EURY|nr:hypothetical protein C479_09213 [Halovivax asiaticus JCM 14624]
MCLALAAADDVHPWESSPLYDAIDHGVLEALEALETRDSRAWQFEFDTGVHTVAVTSSGTVSVDGVAFSDSDLREALDSLDDNGYFDRPLDRH